MYLEDKVIVLRDTVYSPSYLFHQRWVYTALLWFNQLAVITFLPLSPADTGCLFLFLLCVCVYWIQICLYGCVHAVCTCMWIQTLRWRAPSSITLSLTVLRWSGTEPGAHWLARLAVYWAQGLSCLYSHPWSYRCSSFFLGARCLNSNLHVLLAGPSSQTPFYGVPQVTSFRELFNLQYQVKCNLSAFPAFLLLLSFSPFFPSFLPTHCCSTIFFWQSHYVSQAGPKFTM